MIGLQLTEVQPNWSFEADGFVAAQLKRYTS